MKNNLNNAGLTLIKNSEGLSLVAYQDPGGVWTIGYGHTAGVDSGQQITQQQADDFLLQDLATTFAAIQQDVTQTLNDNEFSALSSFVFNLGETAFLNSTLLRMLNQGDFAGAADQFPLWVYDDGQVLPGLVTRRQAERALFLTPEPAPGLRLFAPPEEDNVYWAIDTDREHQLIAWIAQQLGLRYTDDQAQDNKLFLGLPLPSDPQRANSS